MQTNYYDESVQYCEYAISSGTADYGAECGTAVEALFACLSTLDCADFDMGCPTEIEAATLACGGPFVAQLKLAHH